MFAKPFVQAQMKESIKALPHWPLQGESTGELPSQMPVTHSDLRRHRAHYDVTVMDNTHPC